MGFGRLVGQMVEIRRLLLKKTLLRCVAGQDKQHAFHRMAARVSFFGFRTSAEVELSM